MTRRSGARGRRGVILVEFALVGPLLMLLAMTILEGAWQALTAATLDIGAREASRFGATGAAAPEWLPTAQKRSGWRRARVSAIAPPADRPSAKSGPPTRG